MNKNHPHTEAVNLLVNHALPTEAELDAMDATAVAAFLSSQGVDVVKFRTEVKDWKKQLTGKLALAQARKQRLADKTATTVVSLSHMSEADFVEALKRKFGSLEAIPLAARNHQQKMKREDWESLYWDHIMLRKPEHDSSG